MADYTYDAFGNQTEEAEDMNPFRYSGEYYDAETGLIYLRARYYDSGVGGFTSADTHWNVGNMIYGDDNTGIPSIAAIMQSGNLYVYCRSNPVNRFDFTGELEAEDEYVLSKEDYALVWGYTLAFEKAKSVGNYKAMAGAAEQAARIRQKPEYRWKYSSRWEDGLYKKTFEPYAGYKGGNEGVYVQATVITADMYIVLSGNGADSISNALGGATGISALDDIVGPAASAVGFFGNESFENAIQTGGAIIYVQIYDYYRMPGNDLVHYNTKGMYVIGAYNRQTALYSQERESRGVYN